MVFRPWQIVFLLTIIVVNITACKATSSNPIDKRNITFNNGDIAFRRGVGVASRVVLAANHRGSFSHIGIIVEVDGEWCVIHEVPYEGTNKEGDKIYCHKIEEFFTPTKATSGAIYRYDGIDSIQCTKIYNYLLKQLEQNIPFDHNYDLNDSTSQYCSELVWRSFLEIGVDISNGERTKIELPAISGEYILPSDIEVNSNLKLLYRF